MPASRSPHDGSVIANRSELRARGFRALVNALGWVDAVRFLREYDLGSGDYTKERESLLPDLRIDEMVAEIERIQKEASRTTGG